MHIIAKAETDYLYHLLVKIGDKYKIVSAKNAGGFREFYNALDILEYKSLNALLDHKEELMNDQASKD